MVQALILLATISSTSPTPPTKTVATRTASVYSDYFVGRTMANGDKFSQDKMTAASNDFKLGTKLKLEYKGTVVEVIVTDRMHRRFTGKRIDLSRTAFRKLHNKPDGLHKGVKISKV